MSKLKVIILAGGQGTRMKSKVPKVLHKILDKTMVDYVINSCKQNNIVDEAICIVVGNQSAMVKGIVGSQYKYALQKEQLGTGHAVIQAEGFINDNDDILILCGDTPLVKSETIKNLADFHNENENCVTVVSTVPNNPMGYGRIVRENSNFMKIVEEKDCNDFEKEIKEVNTGIYLFKGSYLKKSLSKLSNNNSQNEFYLTDTLEILKNLGEKVGIFLSEDSDEFFGINSKLQLEKASKIMRSRINEYHMLNGVTIEDSATTHIGPDVKIGEDSVILPGTILKGNTEIGTDCVIGPYTNILSSIIKDGVIVQNSTVTNSEIDNFTTVGPYSYIRPNCKIGKHVKIGDFVEIKNSSIDDGTKISHLTYVGDSDVGKNVNFGCGTVTVNYDGKNKFRTTIKDNVFVGCNTNLIAPVELSENSYVGAGSTITKDVPCDALAIARTKQIIKEKWNEKF